LQSQTNELKDQLKQQNESKAPKSSLTKSTSNNSLDPQSAIRIKELESQVSNLKTMMMDSKSFDYSTSTPSTKKPNILSQSTSSVTPSSVTFPNNKKNDLSSSTSFRFGNPTRMVDSLTQVGEPHSPSWLLEQQNNLKTSKSINLDESKSNQQNHNLTNSVEINNYDLSQEKAYSVEENNNQDGEKPIEISSNKVLESDSVPYPTKFHEIMEMVQNGQTIPVKTIQDKPLNPNAKIEPGEHSPLKPYEKVVEEKK